MLDMAKESTVSVGDVAGLLMDELASLVLMDLLDPDLVAWISSTMTDSFISDYIVDIEEGEKSRDTDFIPLELQLLMKMDEEAPIAVNLGPLVCRNMRGLGGGYQVVTPILECELICNFVLDMYALFLVFLAKKTRA